MTLNVSEEQINRHSHCKQGNPNLMREHKYGGLPSFRTTVTTRLVFPFRFSLDMRFNPPCLTYLFSNQPRGGRFKTSDVEVFLEASHSGPGQTGDGIQLSIQKFQKNLIACPAHQKAQNHPRIPSLSRMAPTLHYFLPMRCCARRGRAAIARAFWRCGAALPRGSSWAAASAWPERRVRRRRERSRRFGMKPSSRVPRCPRGVKPRQEWDERARVRRPSVVGCWVFSPSLGRGARRSRIHVTLID